MNKKRLLKLADMLEADAKSETGIQFNLGTVVQMKQWPTDGKVPVDCGTQACAMGLAAISGQFERAGLTYEISDVGFQMRFKDGPKGFGHAAMGLFDIDLSEADFLFTPGGYEELSYRDITGAKAELIVAVRLRDFVAGNVKAPELPFVCMDSEDD